MDKELAEICAVWKTVFCHESKEEDGMDMRNQKQIDGQRQMDFASKFNFVREAGTSGEEKAAQLIREELESFGADCREETFTFKTFRIERARFIVTEPYEKEYTVTGYGRCGNTPLEGIEAPFLYIENGDDISLTYAKDKIVMVNAPVKKEMYGKLAAAGAVGFVSISGTPVDEGEDLIPRAYRLPALAETPLQGVSIHYQDAVEIVTKGASRAKLEVVQENVERTSRNIIARIEGSDKAEEILTLTAHFDSVPEGPGAYDNMAGCAIIMELCRYFMKNRPRRTIEFVWLGAEEKGLLGSQNYVNVHREELAHHRFNMNVDLAGQLVGGTVIGITGDEAICRMITYMAHEIGIGMATRHAIWGSDSNTFAWKGIPAMTLNRDGFGMHTRHDTIELLSPWSLARSAALLGHIAENLANIEIMPFPKKIPEEFMKQLDEYFEG